MRHQAGWTAAPPDGIERLIDPGPRDYTGRSVGAPTRTRRPQRSLADAAEQNGHASDALERFSPAVRDWFASSFEAPTQAQAEGWAAISAGHHTLIHAPTGSGKTLAAFLWCLDRLARTPSPPPARGQTGQVRVLYISPLKALTYDVERNLRAPLTGIGLAAQRLGQAAPTHLRRVADRRHAGRRPSPDRAARAGHPDHDARVALPDAHQRRPRGAARRRARDHRRGPRDRRLEARGAPGAQPRAPRASPSPGGTAAPADRPVRHATAARRDRAVHGRRRPGSRGARSSTPARASRSTSRSSSPSTT